jgi:hypothetical protein
MKEIWLRILQETGKLELVLQILNRKDFSQCYDSDL